MGNLHSNINERIQRTRFFEKKWFDGIVTRFRKLRNEIVAKIWACFAVFRFEEVRYQHVGLGARQTIMRAPPNHTIKAFRGEYQNPMSFWMYQERIRENNRNELKMLFFVGLVNVFWIFLCLFYFLM
ncbi:hypothetical protein L3Y34_019430 [Caenorhabditis briggsae]|uniref:Uncharacterized protein n=1 Tax=Caenorhabditis briggsae TaxID=6238 RepID=A0AAE9IWP0_CAEBR|nr:hypothetical protein L3Y34_019430 [Caenorhabditis briggsae]